MFELKHEHKWARSIETVCRYERPLVFQRMAREDLAYLGDALLKESSFHYQMVHTDYYPKSAVGDLSNNYFYKDKLHSNIAMFNFVTYIDSKNDSYILSNRNHESKSSVHIYGTVFEAALALAFFTSGSNHRLVYEMCTDYIEFSRKLGVNRINNFTKDF